MKMILIALITLIAIPSAQARAIPMDSLPTYLESAKVELQLHIDNLESIAKSLQGSDDFAGAIGTYNIVGHSRSRLVHVTVYFDLINELGYTERICDGLLWAHQNLYFDIRLIQIELTHSKNNLLVVQGNEAKKFIERLARDILESIPNKACKEYMEVNIEQLRHREP